MRYAGKEYRVVCTKSDTHPLQIDIAPANKSLHNLILQERKQRDKSTREIAGSITLYDMGEGNRPEILFLPPENSSLNSTELTAAEENRLRHKITMRFEEMMAQNQESTITVRPEIHRAYVANNLAEVLKEINDTLNRDDAPQSPQEEQQKNFIEREQHASAIRTQTQEYLRHRDEKYSKYGVSALQIKQLIHRDY